MTKKRNERNGLCGNWTRGHSQSHINACEASIIPLDQEPHWMLIEIWNFSYLISQACLRGQKAWETTISSNLRHRAGSPDVGYCAVALALSQPIMSTTLCDALWQRRNTTRVAIRLMAAFSSKKDFTSIDTFHMWPCSSTSISSCTSSVRSPRRLTSSRSCSILRKLLTFLHVF